MCFRGGRVRLGGSEFFPVYIGCLLTAHSTLSSAELYTLLVRAVRRAIACVISRIRRRGGKRLIF